MRIEGIFNNTGKITLHVSMEFDGYYNDPTGQRKAQGRMTKQIYIGEYDISNLKVGTEVEIYYGEPISSKNGVYAPIKKIEILK